MPAEGALGHLRLGFGNDPIRNFIANGGANLYAMGPINTGWCARFMYQGATLRDVKSVYVNFSSVSAPGTVTCRIETVDVDTGKPTGTLYDANATKAFTPAAGWNTITFDTTPTTHLTPGTSYAVVLLTTVGGTTMSLRSNTSPQSYPIMCLTAADGTTRSNFADVGAATPILSLLLTDGATDVEETQGFNPFGAATNQDIYGTRAFGAKLVLASRADVIGVYADLVSRSGTPTDLRFRIYDSADNVVASTTVTVDEDYAPTSARQHVVWFPSAITLNAGTYRIILDQTDHTTTAANYWRIASATARTNLLVPQSFIMTSTTNLDGAPITWVDTTTDVVSVGLVLDSLPFAANIDISNTLIVRGYSPVAY